MSEYRIFGPTLAERDRVAAKAILQWVKAEFKIETEISDAHVARLMHMLRGPRIFTRIISTKVGNLRGELIAFARAEIAAGREFPSMQAMKEKTGASKQSVVYALDKLLRDGIVRRTQKPDRHRYIYELVDMSEDKGT